MPTPPHDSQARASYDAYLAQLGVERFPELEGAHLDFRGADFSGLCLTGANFYEANLEGVQFVGSELFDTCFSHASLDNADLEGALLHDAEFNYMTACNASFRKIRSGEMMAIRSDLSGSDFSDSDLGGLSLIKCDLTNVDFRRSRFSATGFRNSRLYGADFRGVSGSITVGPFDVGENEPQLLKQSEFIEWLHAHGAVNITKYVPPWMKPEDLEEWLSLEE